MDTTKLVKECLELYEIRDEIIEINPVFNYFKFEKDISEAKFIASVEFENHKTVVIRITKENHIGFNTIKKHCEFSEKMRKLGMNTPKKYSSDGSLVQLYNFNGHTLNITVEDYVGPHLEKLDKKLIYSIGELLGQMHKISETNDLTLNTFGYVFNLLGKNEVVLMDKLIELTKEYNIYNELIIKIQELYDDEIEIISDLLLKVKKYAVQGDINLSNLSLINDELWIFDYNIACDEYLIVEAVIEGLLLSYEEECTEDVSVEDKFKSFIEGYQKARILTELEIELLPHIYKVANALWFTKIHINEDSIEESLKRKETKKVNKLIETVYKNILELEGNKYEL